MKYLILFLLFEASMSCSSAVDHKTSVSNQEHMNSQHKLNYDSTILSIKKAVVDLTSSSALFGVKDFIALYENPTLYQEDAIAFLSEEKYSHEEKAIAVYTMQRSELKDYIIFFRKAVSLFHEGKINEAILSETISSSINKRYIIIKNYDNRDVSAILKELKESEKVSSDLKERIENILSGKSWKGVKKLL